EALKQKILEQGPFDVVVVNILADVIAEMMPSLDQYLLPGGKLITSGILDTKAQLIRDSMDANPMLEFEEVTPDGDWVRITARKKEA
ncbi:MAG: 50S ribosomal protein L11 methyltransferase, partial [Lachnospiraceae bacterium]|nr:50S ribosomal protein L11 methyltransferase [Lachnospiraceae bacterium]